MREQPALNPALSREAMEAFLEREYPHAGFGDGRLVLDRYERGACRVVMPLDARNIRPGPSVSGPAMMGLGDIAAWIALLSIIGEVPLAVTSNLTVNFLRPAGMNDLACHCRVLRAGRRLAVMLAEISRVEGRTEPTGPAVAHLTITYAIPDETVRTA